MLKETRVGFGISLNELTYETEYFLGLLNLSNKDGEKRDRKI
jgi:hypothetical protein